jgi:hypothetical protein
VLIIRAKNNDILNTEEIIDDLFGEGHQAHVARMLLSQELTQERMDEIRESVRSKFPKLFETRNKSSLDKMIHDVKSRLDRRLEDNNA